MQIGRDSDTIKKKPLQMLNSIFNFSIRLQTVALPVLHTVELECVIQAIPRPIRKHTVEQTPNFESVWATPNSGVGTRVAGYFTHHLSFRSVSKSGAEPAGRLVSPDEQVRA